MPKITIIEDDDSISYMYKTKFTHAGYQVTTAKNGQEGLRVVEEVMPDIVLLDLKMPVMSGDEMLEIMRSTTWGSEIKVIILTNISRDEAPHTIRHLGISHYVVKSHSTPKQIEELVSRTISLS